MYENSGRYNLLAQEIENSIENLSLADIRNIQVSEKSVLSKKEIADNFLFCALSRNGLELVVVNQHKSEFGFDDVLVWLFIEPSEERVFLEFFQKEC